MAEQIDRRLAQIAVMWHGAIGRDKLFIDHGKEAALLAVLPLHILPRRCRMIIQHLLLTILTEHTIAFRSLPLP